MVVPAFSETVDIADIELGIYKQKVIDAIIDSSMLCLKEGGILKPNYVIPSDELFRISDVKKMLIDRTDKAAILTMAYASEDNERTIDYISEMSTDLTKIYRFKITTSKKSWINLGTLLQPNLIPGPVRIETIHCRSLR